jgi:hypothetical protein
MSDPHAGAIVENAVYGDAADWGGGSHHDYGGGSHHAW